MKDLLKGFGYLIVAVGFFSISAIGYYSIVTIPITTALGLILVGIAEILKHLEQKQDNASDDTQKPPSDKS